MSLYEKGFHASLQADFSPFFKLNTFLKHCLCQNVFHPTPIITDGLHIHVLLVWRILVWKVINMHQLLWVSPMWLYFLHYWHIGVTQLTSKLLFNWGRPKRDVRRTVCALDSLTFSQNLWKHESRLGLKTRFKLSRTDSDSERLIDLTALHLL